MGAIEPIRGNHGKITFAESECSDGMCCFTCVIPQNNGHVGFFKFLRKKGTGYPHIKLLVTSEGYKDELYDSCKFLDFTISQGATDCHLKMDLRCSIYKSRPNQCMGYPDKAGESIYEKISGPCIFNEYAASRAYKQLVYKREWHAFYAVLDHVDAIGNIFAHEEPSVARSYLLKAKDVRLATITVRGRDLDYILIPIPRQTHNILYLSEKHQPIGTIRQAYCQWEQKIQDNLIKHYEHGWETRLNNAIETEEKDAGKRCDEDTSGNLAG